MTQNSKHNKFFSLTFTQELISQISKMPSLAFIGYFCTCLGINRVCVYWKLRCCDATIYYSL